MNGNRSSRMLEFREREKIKGDLCTWKVSVNIVVDK